MPNLISRTFASWREADRRHRDAKRLAQLPDHLLYDMGLTPDGVASLVWQLRQQGKR